MNQQLSFHNTNAETGATLQASQEQACHQETVILRMFRDRPYAGWTPFEVHEFLMLFHNRDWPITSVRRAITNLTRDGDLVKTNIQRMGPYGKKNYVWRVNNVGPSNAGREPGEHGS